MSTIMAVIVTLPCMQQELKKSSTLELLSVVTSLLSHPWVRPSDVSGQWGSSWGPHHVRQRESGRRPVLAVLQFLQI